MFRRLWICGEGKCHLSGSPFQLANLGAHSNGVVREQAILTSHSGNAVVAEILFGLINFSF